MKKIALATILLSLVITGCQKQLEPANAIETKQEQSITNKQFEEADLRISKFLDQLDNPTTSLEVKKQILCVDYPNVYIQQYSPALLKLSPNDYTLDKLDQDLEIALNYYKHEYKIHC